MADREVQPRIAAILAADVGGYTRLMGEDTDGTAAAWQDASDDVVEPTILEHSGPTVKLTGDDFLAEFPTVQKTNMRILMLFGLVLVLSSCIWLAKAAISSPRELMAAQKPASPLSPVLSSVNKLSIQQPAVGAGYKFLVGGHLYGSAYIATSVYPASSLIGGIENLNSKGGAFFISMGDNYRNPSAYEISLFRKSFLDRLDMPVFISPGNHDGANSALYKKEFGAAYSSFRVASDLFILLNTEFPNGDIKDRQKAFLLNSLEHAADNSNIKNIFVFSHKLVWAAGREKYKIVIANVNARNQYHKSQFASQILPALRKVAAKKNVYWGSGDIGNPPSFGLFFQRDDEDGITYFAAGLGDVRDDAVLSIDVSDKSDVSFKAVSLTGRTLRPLADYNLKFWDERYNFISKTERRVRRVLNHSYFKYGIFVGGGGGLLILLALVLWWKNRYRKNSR